MKKKLLLTILAVTVTLIANSQCQSFEWAQSLVPEEKKPMRMIVSPAGDVYTITSHITDETYDYYANSNNLITRLNAQGDTIWTRQINNYNISTTHNDYSVYAEDMALDNAGNLYITGWFAQRVDFDPGPGQYILSSDTWVNGFNTIFGRDAFVMKLDAQGNFAWARKYSNGGALLERFFSLALDNLGNIYVAGQKSMTANDGMLYKIKAGNGDVVWTKNIISNKPRIVLDNTYKLSLISYFSGTADFDPGAGAYNLTSSGSNDVCITRLDTAGNFIWAAKLGGTGDDRGRSLAVDNTGDVFVTGYYTSAATYTPLNGAPVALPTAAGKNGFIAKLNAADGDFSWVSSFYNAPNQAGSIDDLGRGIILDPDEDVYVTATVRTTPNHPTNTYDGTTNFGQQYHGYGSTDIAVFKLNNSDGNFSWINVTGGTGTDEATDIGVDALNGIYVMGMFTNTVDFDPSPQNVFNLVDTNGTVLSNNFLWKLNTQTLASVSHSMCDGEAFDFNGDLLTGAGIYHDTLTAATGCDSIVTLTLNVFPFSEDSIFVSITEGDVYDFNGDQISAAGVYTDSLTNINGCDSLVILTLTVLPTSGANNETSYELDIYPNPTTGIVYFSESVNMEVMNALGQLIAVRENVNSLDLGGHPAGIYLITFTDNKGHVTRQSKIVKQ